METKSIEALFLRARGMGLLLGALCSPAVRDLLDLLEVLAAPRPEPSAVADVFGRLWEGLASGADNLLPDAWQSHLVGRLLDDENPFSLGAERDRLRGAVLEQARLDLGTLRTLFDLDAPVVLGMVEGAVPGLAGIWAPWVDPAHPGEDFPRGAVARKLAAAGDWGAMADVLADHFARHGAGPLGRHRAFRRDGEGLRAVPNPDPVRLSGLIAYEREREPLVDNTRRFLAGLPAHHALLYGQPGTGKSSTVKALLNEYADAGLRLVEVAKEDLGSLPRVLGALRGRGPRFVLARGAATGLECDGRDTAPSQNGRNPRILGTRSPARWEARMTMVGRPSRVVLADDLETVRIGLRMVLSREPGLEVVGEAANGREAVDLCRSAGPDLVVMDVQMPEMDGLAATRRIKTERPATAVLVLTAYEDTDYLLGAVRAGAAGFVLKRNALLRVTEVVRTILEGEPTIDQ